MKSNPEFLACICGTWDVYTRNADSCWARVARTVVNALIPLALLPSLPALAYESDVHYGLTRWLAIQAGFNDADAGILANADQQLDGGLLDAIPRVFKSACLRGDAFEANKVREFHFATEVVVPNPPAARRITPGNKYALTRATDRIVRPLADRTANLLEFGEKLHPLQDTWSHRNVPDIPAIWPFHCRSDYAWGHSLDWGGWNSHDADLTSARPSDAIAMAQATFELLCQYRRDVDKVPCTKTWAGLAKQVGEFSGRTTKKGKRDWFAGQGFKDLNFIQSTTLPESERPVRPLPYVLTPPLSIMDAVSRDDTSQFFAKFFDMWARTRAFDQLAQLFTDQNLFDVDPKATALIKADREAAVLTLQYWRALDHGRMAMFGHRVIDLSPSRRKELASVLDTPGMLEPYREASEAYLPVNEARAPFVITSSQSLTGEPVYLALMRFRHAPNDTIIVTAHPSPKGFRINAIQSLIEH